MSKDSLLTFRVFSKKSFMLENVQFRHNICQMLRDCRTLPQTFVRKSPQYLKFVLPTRITVPCKTRLFLINRLLKSVQTAGISRILSFNILTLHYFENITKAVKFKGNRLQKQSVCGCFQLSIRFSYVTTPVFLFLNVTIRYNGNS